MSDAKALREARIRDHAALVSLTAPDQARGWNLERDRPKPKPLAYPERPERRWCAACGREPALPRKHIGARCDERAREARARNPRRRKT